MVVRYASSAKTERGSSIALVLGSGTAIAAAGLLTPVRGWIGPANVALVLVVVLVATAAVSDRRAAAATAVTAALSFDFFHTRPGRSGPGPPGGVTAHPPACDAPA